MIETSERLKEKIDNIPQLPGVYKMIDSKGNIIYIGKSISLKNRVRSYFTGSSKWGKIERMVSLIDDIEYDLMDTHLEARLEECKLIKEIKPIFNTQFKNDKNYVYLKIEDYNIYKPLTISYTKSNNSYGPFRNRSSLMELISSLKNLYPIISYNNSYEFAYNLIPISMDKNTFNANKKSLEDIFNNSTSLELFSYKLEFKMKESSSLFKFERSAYYKNIIENLNYVRNRLINDKENYNGNILLKIPTQDGFKLFFIQGGEIILKENYLDIKDDTIREFIHKSKRVDLSKEVNVDEKAAMDFKNIIISEIRSLPVGMVIYLKEHL